MLSMEIIAGVLREALAEMRRASELAWAELGKLDRRTGRTLLGYVDVTGVPADDQLLGEGALRRGRRMVPAHRPGSRAGGAGPRAQPGGGQGAGMPPNASASPAGW